MTFLSPLSEVSDEDRRRRKRIAQDGEYLGFEVAFFDSAPRKAPEPRATLSVDQTADQAYQKSISALNDWRTPAAEPRANPASDTADGASSEAKALQDSVNNLNAWRAERSPMQQSNGPATARWL
jgi:hypothetical protein